VPRYFLDLFSSWWYQVLHPSLSRLCKGSPNQIDSKVLQLEDASRVQYVDAQDWKCKSSCTHQCATVGDKDDSPLPYLYSTYYFRNYPKPVSWPTANRTCSRVCLFSFFYIRKKRRMATRAGKVDPQDARRVKHSRIGVWDLYEERQTNSNLLRIPGSSIETFAQMIQNTPYVMRMLKDVLSIRRVQMLLPIFLIMEVSNSLIPAVSLWYVTKLMATYIRYIFAQVLWTAATPCNTPFAFACTTDLLQLGIYGNRETYYGLNSSHPRCSWTPCVQSCVAPSSIRPGLHRLSHGHVHETTLCWTHIPFYGPP
jgi:hypothetical protein